MGERTQRRKAKEVFLVIQIQLNDTLVKDSRWEKGKERSRENTEHREEHVLEENNHRLCRLKLGREMTIT